MSHVSHNIYHMMLGLPAEVSVPDHYELLGLKRFEDDVERIRTAAIDRNRQLLSWQNSAFHAEADRLMGEVVAALEVLLEPQRKATYDQQQGRSTEAEPVATPVADPPPTGGSTGNSWERDLESPQELAARMLAGAVSHADVMAIPKQRQSVPQSVDQPPAWAAIDPRWRLAIVGTLLGFLLIGSWIFFAARPASLVVPFTASEAQAAQQAWAVALGKVSPIERNSIGMVFILIPPGKFLMKGVYDDNAVEVRLTQPFYVSKTEVTQGEWQAVMNTTPWKGQSEIEEDTNCPATYVSWLDAQEFCRRLGEKESVTYRLPTEAEWEYACRAGTTTRFSFGDDATKLSDYGWWAGNVMDGNLPGQYAHRVGLKSANAWGLYDMHGNVDEYCSDWYEQKLSGGRDPTGPSGKFSLMERVIRGGSWRDDRYFLGRDYLARRGLSCSSTSRSRSGIAKGHPTLGFRAVAVLPR